MKKLSYGEFMQVSIMLFGLFFGAGNLIFPPLLGNQAGNAMIIALLSFAITAVVFPVLGTIAVSKTEGLDKLANRVGPTFSLVFTTAIYLSIGPGLGIPRAGSVPFEMAIAPFIPENINLVLARFLYTFVFFGLSLLISLKPKNLVKNVGKYLTPALLILLLVMFAKIIRIPAEIAQPIGDYKKSALAKGFLAGYETLDAVAALNFGFVISFALRNLGIKDKKQVTSYTVKTGILAGLFLFIVYFMLSSIGMVTSNRFVGAANGAEILIKSIKIVFGDFGVILLAVIFTLACLTTCVGLITSGADYFHNLFNKNLSYGAWVMIWTGFSFLMANFGLNNLLALSVPLLTVIYPVSLVLIVMGVSHDLVKYPRISYLLVASLSVILPIIDLLGSFNINIPLLTSLVESLPLASQGLSWLIPSIIGLVVTTIGSKIFTMSYRLGFEKNNF